jgi:isoquinoline 1-oxidoreductase beta subunit
MSALTRRSFLITSAGAGAALLLRLETRADGSASFAPNAFLSIAADGTVTIWVTRSEMGQGVRTSLPMLVAEELDAEWSKVNVRQAEFDAKFGQQRTGGSLSIRELWEPLRRAGATARVMLVDAAAREWNVPVSSLSTENGRVIESRTGRSVSYGRLVAAASALPVPADVTLKSAPSFRIIGTSKRRIDGEDIVTGRARFGLDVRIPGMLFATFARSPVLGGKVRFLRSDAARKVPGVRHILPIDGTAVSWLLQWSSGIAVVADSTGAALRARELLEIEWDEGANASMDQSEIESAVRARFLEPDPEAVTADYFVPYLAHAPLEPMNCVVSVEKDRCRVWSPTQLPQGSQVIAARALGIDPSHVQVEITLMGGGFGRRLYSDYVGEAALISRAAAAPIQLLWTREDDMRHGFFRPLSGHRMSARLDEGRVAAWTHNIAGPSRDAVSGPNVSEPERSEIYAAREMAYDIPAVQTSFDHVYVPIPCGPWRSVAYSQTCFVVESFIDELAHAAGADPVEFRLAHLTRKPFRNHNDEIISPERMQRVLRLAVEKAGPPPRKPAGRGVAVTFDHGSAVAHVADVAIIGGEVRVLRFVTAIDCGSVVNPDHVRAQVEGGIVFGLSAALKGEITIRRGHVEQTSFADCEVLRMREMPRVEVHIVPSGEAPGGVGEPPVPGVAPAVANALFAATGKRLRRLPLQVSALEASPDDNVRVIARLMAALNRHDVEGQYAEYSPDIHFVDEGRRVVPDKEGARANREFESANHARWSFRIVGTAPDAVELIVAEALDFYDLLGVGPRSHRVRYRLREGKIVEAEAWGWTQRGRPYEETRDRFVRWVEKERPEDAARIVRDGRLLFRKEHAAAINGLVREWRTAEFRGDEAMAKRTK